MRSDCIFCRILAGDERRWLVYEDHDHAAFLTPFPNTPGFTVLVTKEHLTSNVMHLGEDRYLRLMRAAQELSSRIELSLGVKRVALVIEGMGVDHAHVKLIPLHGIPDGPWQPMLASEPSLRERYEGFITTHDGPRMSDERLDEIQRLLNAGEPREHQ